MDIKGNTGDGKPVDDLGICRVNYRARHDVGEGGDKNLVMPIPQRGNRKLFRVKHFGFPYCPECRALLGMSYGI